MKKSNIYFRADGGSTIGLGHVIRSLALADMLQKTFNCHFIIRNPLPKIKNQILEIGINLITLDDTLTIKEEANKIATEFLKEQDFIVLDGYHFKTEYQEIIKRVKCKLVCIDDIYAYHFVADAIINHVGGISSSLYSTTPNTLFCLGPKYVLLRQAFLNSTLNYTEREESIFICLGGADPKNDTLEVLKRCESAHYSEKIYVVIGAAYRFKPILDQYLQNTSLNISLLTSLNATEMVHYMKKCNKAITSPSTISYEYLSIGGELYLKIIADNQIKTYEYFVDQGLAFDFDTKFLKVKQQDLQISFQKQTQIFDSKQQKRFIKLFNYLQLEERHATIDDCLLYYNWANDPSTRMQSYNTEPIPFESHKKWFENRITLENCIFYVIEMKGIPIGQIRFDIKNKVATISYSLDKEYRGKGLGQLLLKKGLEVFKKENGNSYKIIGFVKEQNIASCKAFRNLDFLEQKAKALKNSYKYTLI